MEATLLGVGVFVVSYVAWVWPTIGRMNIPKEYSLAVLMA